ncbi:MAG: DUF1043 family protein [Myxococcota bacterium]|nr:DUF1043 family protein [Myxococcota bacterium]
MLQEMVPLEIVIPLGVLGALLFFVFGRVTATSSRRVQELQSTLDDALAEREQTRKDAESARTALEESQKEASDYRDRVADHFTETSHRLHELTLQYRAVYDHLADGASELCPDGFQKLEGGLGLDALPESTQAETAPTPTPPAEPAAAASSDEDASAGAAAAADDEDAEASTAEARGGFDTPPDLAALDPEADALDAAEQVRVRGG